MADLHHGPLIKSLYTQQLELITKFMLYSPNDVTIETQDSVPQPQPRNRRIRQHLNSGINKKTLHAKIGGIDIDLTSLFKKANFTHLEISEHDSLKYMTNKSVFTFGLVARIFAKLFSRLKPNFMHEFTSLTAAERHVVGIYTGSGYININNMLYDKNQSYGNQSYTTKEHILQAVLLGSGLNKIMPNPKNHNVKSYRGERHVPEEEIQERIKLVNQGGGYTEQPAFMSTSTSMSVSQSFSGGKCLIIFDSIYGASIQKLSSFIGEYEFLLPPGQIYWKSYQLVNGRHTFHADAVKPLIPGKDDPSEQDIANFNKLLELAHKKGIPINFLKPHLHDKVSNPQIKAALTQPVPQNVNPAIPGNSRFHREQILESISFLVLMGLGIFILAAGLGYIPLIVSSTISWMAVFSGGALALSAADNLMGILKKYLAQHQPAQAAAVHPTPLAVQLEPVIQPQTAVPAVQPDTIPAIQTEPVPAMEPQLFGGTIENPYQVLLENEEKAIKSLENTLIGKNQEAQHFITKLHTILGLDKPHSDKLLLLQYAHILEFKVNDTHPDHFAAVEKEVLDEATTTMKDNTLFGKN